MVEPCWIYHGYVGFKTVVRHIYGEFVAMNFVVRSTSRSASLQTSLVQSYSVAKIHEGNWRLLSRSIISKLISTYSQLSSFIKTAILPLFEKNAPFLTPLTLTAFLSIDLAVCFYYWVKDKCKIWVFGCATLLLTSMMSLFISKVSMGGGWYLPIRLVVISINVSWLTLNWK